MNIDTIIIFLLVAIALVAIVILLRGGSEKKVYDPNDVDLGNAFDPQHDHFSKEHVQKLKEQGNKTASSAARDRVSPNSVAARGPRSEMNSGVDGLQHLKRPRNVESQQSKGHKNRREAVSRRMDENRRRGDRRMKNDRRGKES